MNWILSQFNDLLKNFISNFDNQIKQLLLKYVGDNKLLDSKISLFGKPEDI